LQRAFETALSLDRGQHAVALGFETILQPRAHRQFVFDDQEALAGGARVLASPDIFLLVLSWHSSIRARRSLAPPKVGPSAIESYSGSPARPRCAPSPCRRALRRCASRWSNRCRCPGFRGAVRCRGGKTARKS